MHKMYNFTNTVSQSKYFKVSVVYLFELFFSIVKKKKKPKIFKSPFEKDLD